MKHEGSQKSRYNEGMMKKKQEIDTKIKRGRKGKKPRIEKQEENLIILVSRRNVREEVRRMGRNSVKRIVNGKKIRVMNRRLMMRIGDARKGIGRGRKVDRNTEGRMGGGSTVV